MSTDTVVMILTAIGIVVSIIVGVFAIVANINKHTDKRFTEWKSYMDKQFAGLKSDMDKQFAELRTSMQALNARIDNVLLSKVPHKA